MFKFSFSSEGLPRLFLGFTINPRTLRLSVDSVLIIDFVAGVNLMHFLCVFVFLGGFGIGGSQSPEDGWNLH